MYLQCSKSKKASGVIALSGCTSCSSAEDWPSQGRWKYGFEVKAEQRVFKLMASVAQDQAHWIQMIQAGIDKQRSAHQEHEEKLKEQEEDDAAHDAVTVERRSLPPPSNSMSRTKSGSFVPISHVCSGYLVKLGQKVKNWKRRWFSLKDQTVSYFQQPRGSKCLGRIDMTKCLDIGESEDQELQFAFKIVLPQRTYVLQADTEQDRSMWLYCLRLAMEAQPAESSGAQRVQSRNEALKAQPVEETKEKEDKEEREENKDEENEDEVEKEKEEENEKSDNEEDLSENVEEQGVQAETKQEEKETSEEVEKDVQQSKAEEEEERKA